MQDWNYCKPTLFQSAELFFPTILIPFSFTEGSQSEEDKSQTKGMNERCLADELQEALLKAESVEDDVFLPNEQPTAKQCLDNSKIYPKFSGRYLDELKSLQFSNSVSKNTKPFLNSNNIYLEEDSSVETKRPSVASASGRDGREFDGKMRLYFDRNIVSNFENNIKLDNYTHTVTGIVLAFITLSFGSFCSIRTSRTIN